MYNTVGSLKSLRKGEDTFIITETLTILTYLFLRKYFGWKIKFMEHLLRKIETKLTKRKALTLALLLWMITLPGNQGFKRQKK